MDRFGYGRPEGADRPSDWARPGYASELLGDHFGFEFHEAVCPWTGESGEAIWQLTIGSDGPAKTGLRSQTRGEREALHRDWVDYFERHRADGGISASRPYFVLLGRRR